MVGNPVRFWHLSDLHLYPCGGLGGECDCGETTCVVSIKQRLLRAIAHELEHTHSAPEMLLLTGDIFDCTENQAPDAMRLLQPVLDAADRRGTSIYGILGDDGHDGAVRRKSAKPKWEWLMKSREERTHSSGIKVVAVCEGSQPDVRRVVGGLPDPKATSILLAHAAEVPTTTPHNYRALGHVHTSLITPIDEGHVSGRPGHLYSYWDGPGKAWPVFMIAGTIDADSGHVNAWRVPLEAPPFSAPATRQIYGDVGGYEQRTGALYLVHAPVDGWFYRGAGLDAQYVEFLPHTGAVKATFRFTSKGARDEIIRNILSACPNDVFVTPSTGTGNADRIKLWARTIAGDDALFDRFVARSFKRTEVTQTSDQ